MDLTNIEYRILTLSDLKQFDNFIIKTNNLNDDVWDFVKKNLAANHKEFIVGGMFSYDELVAIAVGYSLNFRWNRPNFFPYWIIGRMQSILPIPNLNDRDKLLSLLTNHFENLGFYSCYTVKKVSNKINYKNVDNFLTRYTKKAFKADRYNSSIEAIFPGETFNFENINSLYKLISYKYCEKNKSILIIRYDLKNKFKK